MRTRGTTGCTRWLSIDGRDVQLPSSGQTRVRLGTRDHEKLTFTCSMGMYGGAIHFSP